MVDFKKLMEERKAASQKLKAEVMKQPTVIVPKAKEPIDDLRHLMNNHVDELNEWEYNFVLNNFNYLKLNPGAQLSARVKDKLGEILADLCDKGCTNG
jgi:hypothetical protein